MKHELCKYSELESFDAYLASLSSPIDSFLEEHILESQFYRIVAEGREIGFFAAHHGSLLTQFHLVAGENRYGQEVLADILGQNQLRMAFVPTCDEFFLSHELDKYVNLKKQALFFIDSKQPIKLKGNSLKAAYRSAEQSDVSTIQAISGNFVDDLVRRVSRHEIHVGHLNGEIIAIGLIIKSQLWANQASIGMFTHEAYRRQGIGAQTVLYLKHVCHNCDMRPLAGCRYNNTKSQMTLQAAGMVTMTRLLRFTF